VNDLVLALGMVLLMQSVETSVGIGSRITAIQTPRDWELQQDDSIQKVVRQLRTLKKRVKREIFTGLQQTTLTSYFP
jgi:hypothetical protein